MLPQHLRCGLQSTTIREGDGRRKERRGRKRWRGEERGGVEERGGKDSLSHAYKVAMVQM